MAMEQLGYVAKIDDGIAKIRVDRESACGGNCGACHGCPNTAVLVSFPNDPQDPFSIGEKVRILMPTGTFFFGIIKSYGVLILSVLAGAVLGYSLNQSEGFSVLGAGLGLVLGGCWVHVLSRKSKPSMRIQRMDR